MSRGAAVAGPASARPMRAATPGIQFEFIVASLVPSGSRGADPHFCNACAGRNLLIILEIGFSGCPPARTLVCSASHHLYSRRCPILDSYSGKTRTRTSPRGRRTGLQKTLAYPHFDDLRHRFDAFAARVGEHARSRGRPGVPGPPADPWRNAHDPFTPELSP